MSERLNDFEIKILEECAGLRKPSRWGAAVGAALEFLRGSGFIGRDGELTDKGRAQIFRQKSAN